MTVELEAGAVVCAPSDGWERLAENEHKFLHDCYGYAVWVDFTANGKLKMRMPEKAQRVAESLRIMLAEAKAHNIEVLESVNSFYDEWKAKADAEKEQEKRIARMEGMRRAWEYRQRTGCDGCRDCERIGDGWFRCKYSGDDLDARFSEQYDPETRSMVMFYEVGIPNNHCKDYVGEVVKCTS